MQAFLLLILYICFVSLGLPDALLGIAWPQIRLEFGAPLSMAGAISVFTAVFSTLASFLSGKALSRFGTRNVTILSCFMTGTGILLYSFIPSMSFVFLISLLLGFGAGTVDSGLNHYVSKHYSSRHMSWLHCCWGVGATLGPLIFTTFGGGEWRRGYLSVGILQLAIAVFLLATIRVWKLGAPKNMNADMEMSEDTGSSGVSAVKLFFTKKALLSSGTFFVYCSAEFGMGLWLTSMLIESQGFNADVAGYWTTAYWGSLMASRFLGGLITDRVGNRRMIIFGIAVAFTGTLLLLLGMTFGIILVGAGYAPVYPCMMHETSRRFKPAEAVHMIGFQSGMAMIGCSLTPAIMGIIFQHVSLGLLPAILAALLLLALAIQFSLNKLSFSHIFS